MKERVNELRSFLRVPERTSTYEVLLEAACTLKEQDKTLAFLQHRKSLLEARADVAEINDAAGLLVELAEADQLPATASPSSAFSSLSSSSFPAFFSTFSASSSSLFSSFSASSPCSSCSSFSSSSALVPSGSAIVPLAFDFELFEKPSHDHLPLQQWMTPLAASSLALRFGSALPFS